MTVATTVPANMLPGARDIPGLGVHLRNSLGHLVHIDAINPADLLEHELVYKITDYGLELRGYMARFLAHSRTDLGDYDAVLAQEYKIDAGARSKKGNRTYTSFDALRQVEVKMQDRRAFGPQLDVARAGLDDMIRRHGAGARPILMTLVSLAFGVGEKEDKVDMAALLALRRQNFDDEAWPDIQRAIGDAIRVVGTKEYLRILARPNLNATFEPIKLALSAIDPAPEDFDLPSPRRQVEQSRPAVTAALECLKDGNVTEAAVILARLLRDLGGDVTDEVSAWVDACCNNYTVKETDDDMR